MTFKCLLGHDWGAPYDRTVRDIWDEWGNYQIAKRFIFWQTCQRCNKTTVNTKKVYN